MPPLEPASQLVYQLPHTCCLLRQTHGASGSQLRRHLPTYMPLGEGCRCRGSRLQHRSRLQPASQLAHQLSDVCCQLVCLVLASCLSIHSHSILSA